jgi:hypothetical protein
MITQKKTNNSIYREVVKFLENTSKEDLSELFEDIKDKSKFKKKNKIRSYYNALEKTFVPNPSPGLTTLRTIVPSDSTVDEWVGAINESIKEVFIKRFEKTESEIQQEIAQGTSSWKEFPHETVLNLLNKKKLAYSQDLLDLFNLTYQKSDFAKINIENFENLIVNIKKYNGFSYSFKEFDEDFKRNKSQALNCFYAFIYFSKDIDAELLSFSFKLFETINFSEEAFLLKKIELIFSLLKERFNIKKDITILSDDINNFLNFKSFIFKKIKLGFVCNEFNLEHLIEQCYFNQIIIKKCDNEVFIPELIEELLIKYKKVLQEISDINVCGILESSISKYKIISFENIKTYPDKEALNYNTSYLFLKIK